MFTYKVMCHAMPAVLTNAKLHCANVCCAKLSKGEYGCTILGRNHLPASPRRPTQLPRLAWVDYCHATGDGR